MTQQAPITEPVETEPIGEPEGPQCCHHWVIRVFFLHDISQPFELLEYRDTTFGVRGAFHFIAKPPDQHGRMAFVFSNCCENLCALFLDRGQV